MPVVPEHHTAGMRQDRALVGRDDRADLPQILERAFGIDARMTVGILEVRNVESDVHDPVADPEHHLVLGLIKQVPGLLDRQDQRPVVLTVYEAARTPNGHQPRALVPAP